MSQNSALFKQLFKSLGKMILLFLSGRWPKGKDCDLAMAIHLGKKSRVRELIDAGVYVDQYDENGMSMLQIAVMHNRTEIAKMLIEAGADVNKSVSFVWGDKRVVVNSVFNAALHHRNAEIVRCMLEACQDREMLKGALCHIGSAKVAKVLIDYGADVNEMEDDGGTPLVNAVLYKQYKLAKLLIESGADVNRGKAYGYTALQLARKYKSGRFERLLLSAGATA